MPHRKLIMGFLAACRCNTPLRPYENAMINKGWGVEGGIHSDDAEQRPATRVRSVRAAQLPAMTTLLITGARGQLGTDLLAAAATAGLNATGLGTTGGRGPKRTQPGSREQSAQSLHLVGLRTK